MHPSEEDKRQLQAKLGAAVAEKAALEEELASWKARVDSLVSKYHQVMMKFKTNIERDLKVH